MTARWKPCRCGRNIPADWPECGECREAEAHRILEEDADEVGFRFHALRQLQAAGHSLGADPLPEDFVAKVADLRIKHAQEAGYLTIRAVRRIAMHQAVLARYDEMNEMDRY